MNIHIVLFICLLVAALNSSSGAEIGGVVLDRESQPIPGAIITLESTRLDEMIEYTTTSTGNFYIEVEPGSYSLYGPGEGYSCEYISLLHSDSATNIVLMPYRETRCLSVRVEIEADDTDPVQVRLYPGKEGGISIYDVEGFQKNPSTPQFIYTNLYPGIYEFIFSAGRYSGNCTVEFTQDSLTPTIYNTYVVPESVQIELWLDDHKGTGVKWPKPGKGSEYQPVKGSADET